MPKKINLDKEQRELANLLTPLQRNTAINHFLGMSQRQAYLKANGKAKTESAQDSSAGQILNKVEVKKFTKSLEQAASKETIASKVDALNVLSKIMKDDEVMPNHRVSAIKQLSTMEGWDAPAEVKHSGIVQYTKIERKIV